MPSATGQNWEKYKKEFADDEEPEKKITPLTDEYVTSTQVANSCKAMILIRGSVGIYKCSRPMVPLPMLLASKDSKSK